MGISIKDLLGNRANRTEKALVDKAEEWFKKDRSQRYDFERQWYINMAFYFGKHYVQWANPALGPGGWNKLYEPASPKWRVRLVSNKIKPIVRAELSKVTKEHPTGYVIPASSDMQDVLASRAAEKTVEHLWRELHMDRMKRRAQFWNMICGTSFLKDWYDDMEVDADGVRGTISVEPLSPFHLLVPDLQEEELDNQERATHIMAKSPAWVDQVYGVRLEPDSNAAGGLLEQKFFQALGLPSDNNYVSVKEMWVRPCREYPEGAMIVWARDQLLHFEEGWPFDHGQVPFTKFTHIPTGRFYGDSTIVDLIPLQREFNRTRSQIIEAKNRMSKPQLLAYKGSVNPNMVTSEPGLIIFVKQGYQMPVPLALQNIPSYVIEELNRIQRDMDDISSQHEITKGGTPPGVTAATAIAYLQEEDDSKLAPTIASLEEGVERLCRHFLSHVDQFWTAERQVRTVGFNNQFEAAMFSKASIKGNTDYRVQRGSATPRSLAAKQAFITELGKLGWVPPDRALRYLGMAETERMWEEMQLDARQAQRENMRMALADVGPNAAMQEMMGQPLNFPINTYDNDPVHVVEHSNFCKTQEFEALPQPRQQIILRHIEDHKIRMGYQQFGIMLPAGDPRLPQSIQVKPGEQAIQPQAPQTNVQLRGSVGI